MERRDFLKNLFLGGIAIAVPVKLFDKLTEGLEQSEGRKLHADDSPFPTTNDKCVWLMGTLCDGITYSAEMFKKQIRIPICTAHLVEHRVIMSLVKAGKDIEDVINVSAEDRIKMLGNLSLIPWSEV
jgi:hypothetical protein